MIGDKNMEAIFVEVDNKKYRVEKKGLFKDITPEQAQKIIEDLQRSEEERGERRRWLQETCKLWWRNLR